MRDIKLRLWNGSAYEPVGEIAFHTDGSYHVNGEYPVNDSYANQFDGAKYVIEQFSGLLDRNGVEIYEGDILVRHHPKVEPLDMSFVKDLTGTGQMIIPNALVYGREAFTETVLVAIPSIYVTETHTEDYEIGGNVHQHPELLTERKAN